MLSLGICGSGVLVSSSPLGWPRTRKGINGENDFHSQFERISFWPFYAVSAESGIAGCLLTAAIREERSSYRENSVASAQRGKVKDAEQVPYSTVTNTDGSLSCSFLFMMTKEKYETYLLSQHWREFSIRAKVAKRYCCEECHTTEEKARKKFRQGLNVHHKTYENLGREKLSDVEVLCYGCHMARHGQGGWVAFLERFSMPSVEKIPLHCTNCGAYMGHVYNSDEIYERGVGDRIEHFCRDCRRAG
jgi:hypothetical protein